MNGSLLLREQEVLVNNEQLVRYINISLIVAFLGRCAFLLLRDNHFVLNGFDIFSDHVLYNTKRRLQ